MTRDDPPLTSGDHRAHLAVGAALTLAGAVSAASAARAGRRHRAAHALTAVGLGWLGMRYAALSQRVTRTERASGAWRVATPAEAAAARTARLYPWDVTPAAEPWSPPAGGGRRRAGDIDLPPAAGQG